MAPIRGPQSRQAKPLKSILKNSSSTPASVKSDPLFPSSKKDKRRIKHAQLMSKVTKSATTKPRRRRPNKKLVTTLHALADALPSAEDESNGKGASTVAGGNPEEQVNIIKRKSMKSRPGAMKRREKLDKGERDRFAKNMAQLAAPKPNTEAGKENSEDMDTAAAQSAVPSTSDRWAALRGFISQTLETKPELRNLKS